MKTLKKILSLRRGHGGAGVAVLATWLESQGFNPVAPSPTSEPLAWMAVIGTSRTLFSAHIDTVHSSKGSTSQKIHLDKGVMSLANTPKNDNNVLGADDGAGVWLLLELFKAGVPGIYVIHAGEEVGGIGSSGIAAEFPDFLTQFDRAIAFDRKGVSDVITHQGYDRCCSDEFANALSAALSTDDLLFQPSSEGVFTDTANYTHVIPECTNVSIGYENCHTSKETLNTDFLFALRDQCLKVDWEALPTVRDPLHAKYQDYWERQQGVGTYSDHFMDSWSYDEVQAWVHENRSDPELLTDTIFDLITR